VAVALLIVGLAALLFAWHVHHPLRRPGELAASVFVLAWLGGELPLHCAALFVGAAAWLVAEGALSEPLGLVGLACLCVAGLGPIASWRQATRTRDVLARAFGEPLPIDLSWFRFLVPVHFADREVVCTPNVRRDGERLKADLYRPRTPPDGPRPLLVYVHGGGWVLGFRRWQGRLLIRRLVRSGWVAVSIQYRLSPWATWPDHIIDVKRALAWARRMAPSWNADPRRIALSGNSAGGHLATLAALSPDVAEWQPGFETADTRVQALVSWYGIYDLVAAVDGSPEWHGGLRRLWRLLVMKRALGSAEAEYRAASPASHFGEHAPPALLIHGELDTLVPVATARAFAKTCAESLPERVTYLEIPGAEHAFDVFTSRRGAYAVEAAARWLERELDQGPKSERPGSEPGRQPPSVGVSHSSRSEGSASNP